MNNVQLTYSNNPHTNGTGTTVDHPAYDYTYGIDVTKVGSDEDETGKPKTLEAFSSRCMRKTPINISRPTAQRRQMRMKQY